MAAKQRPLQTGDAQRGRAMMMRPYSRATGGMKTTTFVASANVHSAY